MIKTEHNVKTPNSNTEWKLQFNQFSLPFSPFVGCNVFHMKSVFIIKNCVTFFRLWAYMNSLFTILTKKYYD